MVYNFTKECETGIESIDNEHRVFFQYINLAVDEINGSGDNIEAVAKNLIKKLRDYANQHFENEEKYMKAHHDGELILQIKEHEAFREKLSHIENNIEYTKEGLSKVIDFMARWLYSHILTSDIMIGFEHTNGRFVMTDAFKTGVPIIDEEHATLFNIINEAWDVLADKISYDKYDKIAAILERLKEYAVSHFADEEAHMESVGYAGLEAQKRVHQAFVDKVVHLDLSVLDEDGTDQDDYIINILSFLNDWLVNHILKMDIKIPQKAEEK